MTEHPHDVHDHPVGDPVTEAELDAELTADDPDLVAIPDEDDPNDLDAEDLKED